MSKKNQNQLTMFGNDSICNENSLFYGIPTDAPKPAENSSLVRQITIKGQKAIEVLRHGVTTHYVEIEKDWFSVNGGHFDGHLGGIRWQVDLEMPSGAEDKALVAYLEKTRVKKYEIGGGYGNLV